MNPQIEKFIDLIIADGEITEKERNVIINKASELGLDINEVEVILEGKLSLLKNEKKITTSKHGELKKCPSCGSPITLFVVKCEFCDYEFSATKTNVVIDNISDNINKIINEYNILIQGIDLEDLNSDEKIERINSNRDHKIAYYIKHVPIPTNKEDLIEFLSYAYALGNDKSLDKNGYPSIMPKAWRDKLQETILKSKVLFKNDAQLFNLINEYESRLSTTEKKLQLKSTATQSFNFILGLVFISLVIWWFFFRK